MGMEASISQLHDDTEKVLRSVISNGEKITLTDEGCPCAQVIPMPYVDRKAALAVLRSIGPVELPARK